VWLDLHLNRVETASEPTFTGFRPFEMDSPSPRPSLLPTAADFQAPRLEWVRLELCLVPDGVAPKPPLVLVVAPDTYNGKITNLIVAAITTNFTHCHLHGAVGGDCYTEAVGGIRPRPPIPVVHR
jgi:hypothetical protein